MNTAGGNIREASILEAAKTIKLGDFKELHKKPCARDSFLVGIGAGFGVGGLRAVIGGWFFSLLHSPLYICVLSSFLHLRLIFIYIYVLLTASTRVNSPGPESLQLGGWCFCIWVLFYARVLSKEEAVGDSGP